MCLGIEFWEKSLQCNRQCSKGHKSLGLSSRGRQAQGEWCDGGISSSRGSGDLPSQVGICFSGFIYPIRTVLWSAGGAWGPGSGLYRAGKNGAGQMLLKAKEGEG